MEASNLALGDYGVFQHRVEMVNTAARWTMLCRTIDFSNAVSHSEKCAAKTQ